jgi:hypothetical protein
VAESLRRDRWIGSCGGHGRQFRLDGESCDVSYGTTRANAVAARARRTRYV